MAGWICYDGRNKQGGGEMDKEKLDKYAVYAGLGLVGGFCFNYIFFYVTWGEGFI